MVLISLIKRARAVDAETFGPNESCSLCQAMALRSFRRPSLSARQRFFQNALSASDGARPNVSRNAFSATNGTLILVGAIWSMLVEPSQGKPKSPQTYVFESEGH